MPHSQIWGWEESGDALIVLLLWPVNVARHCGVQRRRTLPVGDAWLPMTLHLSDQRGSLSTGVHTENRHPGPLEVRAGAGSEAAGDVCTGLGAALMVSLRPRGPTRLAAHATTHLVPTLEAGRVPEQWLLWYVFFIPAPLCP